jgi:hypothetical protein
VKAVFVTHSLEAVLEFLNQGNYLAAVATLLSTLGGIGWDAFQKDMRSKFDVGNQVLNDLKNFANDLYNSLAPDPEGLKEAWDKTNELLHSVQEELGNVFTPIASTVQSGLGTGDIPAQTDGGLGQTYDNFAPQGDVPINVGSIPGMGTDAAGMGRGSDGGSGYGSGGGGYGGGGSGPAPLGGGSGADSGNSTGDSGVSTMPTASDLGIDPNSGAYIEYQPTAGQVQITYPDGSTETRPWPKQ